MATAKRGSVADEDKLPHKRQAKLTSLWGVAVPAAGSSCAAFGGRKSVDVSGIKGFQYVTEFLPNGACARYYRELAALGDWEYAQVVLMGKPCTMNRMTCSFSLDGTVKYRYSGVAQKTRPFSASLAVAELVDAVETMFVKEQDPPVPRINYVLLNYYKDGTDSLGLHADSEQDLVGPVYGISLNQAGDDESQRRFFDIVENETGVKTRLPLDNGSLMVMRSVFQKLYKHGVPEQRRITSGRINLTMRSIRE